jgi:hypothetical protein
MIPKAVRSDRTLLAMTAEIAINRLAINRGGMNFMDYS